MISAPAPSPSDHLCVSSKFGMIIAFFLLLLFIIGVAILTGRGRHGNVYGPPIWRWAEWKAHWRPGRSPLSDPLYRAIPPNEWLTCDEIFERVPRSVIGQRAEVAVR